MATSPTSSRCAKAVVPGLFDYKHIQCKACQPPTLVKAYSAYHTACIRKHFLRHHQDLLNDDTVDKSQFKDYKVASKPSRSLPGSASAGDLEALGGAAEGEQGWADSASGVPARRTTKRTAAAAGVAEVVAMAAAASGISTTPRSRGGAGAGTPRSRQPGLSTPRRSAGPSGGGSRVQLATPSALAAEASAFHVSNPFAMDRGLEASLAQHHQHFSPMHQAASAQRTPFQDLPSHGSVPGGAAFAAGPVALPTSGVSWMPPGHLRTASMQASPRHQAQQQQHFPTPTWQPPGSRPLDWLPVNAGGGPTGPGALAMRGVDGGGGGVNGHLPPAPGSASHHQLDGVLLHNPRMPSSGQWHAAAAAAAAGLGGAGGGALQHPAPDGLWQLPPQQQQQRVMVASDHVMVPFSPSAPAGLQQAGAHREVTFNLPGAADGGGGGRRGSDQAALAAGMHVPLGAAGHHAGMLRSGSQPHLAGLAMHGNGGMHLAATRPLSPVPGAGKPLHPHLHGGLQLPPSSAAAAAGPYGTLNGSGDHLGGGAAAAAPLPLAPPLLDAPGELVPGVAVKAAELANGGGGGGLLLATLSGGGVPGGGGAGGGGGGGYATPPGYDSMDPQTMVEFLSSLKSSAAFASQLAAIRAEQQAADLHGSPARDAPAALPGDPRGQQAAAVAAGDAAAAAMQLQRRPSSALVGGGGAAHVPPPAMGPPAGGSFGGGHHMYSGAEGTIMSAGALMTAMSGGLSGAAAAAAAAADGGGAPLRPPTPGMPRVLSSAAAGAGGRAAAGAGAHEGASPRNIGPGAAAAAMAAVWPPGAAPEAAPAQPPPQQQHGMGAAAPGADVGGGRIAGALMRGEPVDPPSWPLPGMMLSSMSSGLDGALRLGSAVGSDALGLMESPASALGGLSGDALLGPAAHRQASSAALLTQQAVVQQQQQQQQQQPAAQLRAAVGQAGAEGGDAAAGARLPGRAADGAHAGAAVAAEEDDVPSWGFCSDKLMNYSYAQLLRVAEQTEGPLDGPGAAEMRGA